MSAQNPAGRSVPMEVLVLGYGRTGTQSLSQALTILGYNRTYHMIDVFMRNDYPYWIAAMEAKYDGKGQPFGREEFDKFLGDYMAVTDFPAAIFADELIAAYPSAKVILSIRDEDAWFKSVQDTIWHRWYAGKQAKQQTPSQSSGTESANPLQDLMITKLQAHVWQSDFPAHGRQAFREHNEHVRQLMKDRKEDFLEYNVQEGWDLLCRFLGKEVPGQPFPRSDVWADYKEKVKLGENPIEWAGTPPSTK